MTVSSQTPVNSSTGNGATTVFPYSFRILAAADIEVAIDGVVKTLSTHYTLSGVGDAGGGNITFLTAPASGTTVTRRRNMAFVRTTDYQYQGDLPTDVLNSDQDAPVMMLQQLQEQIDRTPKFPLGADASSVLPSLASLLGKFLAVDADGNWVAATGTGADAGLRADLAAAAGGTLVGIELDALGSVLRSVASKYAESVSITDFVGADPTGVADSSAALTAALAAAGKVYIPEGVFVIDEVTVDGALIYGPGTLKWKAASTGPMLDFRGGAMAEGVLFDGNASNQVGSIHAITVTESTHSRFAFCRFTNFRYRCIVTDMVESTHGTIIGCEFYDTGTLANGNPVNIRASYWKVVGNSFLRVGNAHCVRIGYFNEDVNTTPIVGTNVSGGNVFKDTEHCGVTCELYAQHTTINGNTFDGLEHGIKGEVAGGTVFNIVIVGNTFLNITEPTSLNLTVPNVTFVGNNCNTMAGGPHFGPNFVCVGNTIKNITNPAIAAIYQSMGSSGGTCTGNFLHTMAYRGIVLNEGVTCTGNHIFNSAATMILIDGADNMVRGNILDTAAGTGIQLTSAALRCMIDGNQFIAISGTKISFSDVNDTCTIGENMGWEGATYGRSIVSGAITIPRGARYIGVDTEAAAATDDLDTLNGGAYIGQQVTLVTTSNARDITVKDNTGNIRCGGDRLLDNTDDTITLIWNGTVWKEVSYANNA